MIDKGRYVRPRIERHERKCVICKDRIEDEIRSLNKCPLMAYASPLDDDEERKTLLRSCRENSANFDKQKFIFILSIFRYVKRFKKS